MSETQTYTPTRLTVGPTIYQHMVAEIREGEPGEPVAQIWAGPRGFSNAERLVASFNSCLPFADPQTAIPQLIEALKAAHVFMRNGIELGYIRMPDKETNDPASLVPAKVSAALALVKQP